jgi:hypothetical protein
METAEILIRFETFKGNYEREAVEAAIAQREAITPALLRILEELPARADEPAAADEYMAHLYAMFLLAQFRETRAYPLLIRIMLLPGDLLDSLFGDSVVDHLGKVLASVCGGDIAGLQSIIHNENADEWARYAALNSLVSLVAVGQISRDEIIAYFATLFRGNLARTPENEIVWSALVSSTADLYPEELFQDIEQAYNDDLIDPTFVDLEDVRLDLAKDKDRVLAALATNPDRKLVQDTAEEMAWWYCFHVDKEELARDGTLALDGERDWDEVVAPIKREGPKIGRNDPCPCGSGKKYKKCCLE